jgi:hypothetical protein
LGYRVRFKVKLEGLNSRIWIRKGRWWRCWKETNIQPASLARSPNSHCMERTVLLPTRSLLQIFSNRPAITMCSDSSGQSLNSSFFHFAAYLSFCHFFGLVRPLKITTITIEIFFFSWFY